MRWCCLVAGRWGESWVPFDTWEKRVPPSPLGRRGVCGAAWGSADVPLSGEGRNACLLQPLASCSMAWGPLPLGSCEPSGRDGQEGLGCSWGSLWFMSVVFLAADSLVPNLG